MATLSVKNVRVGHASREYVGNHESSASGCHMTPCPRQLTISSSASCMWWVRLPISDQGVRVVKCDVLVVQDTHPAGWGNSKLRPTA